MLDSDFLRGFKQATEAKWRVRSIDPTKYGFQFQPGTRWRAGLTEEEIKNFEEALAVPFPVDFRAFLREMNGTDLPTLNVYGSCGEPRRYSVGVYSYPQDIELVKQRIEDIGSSRPGIASDLAGQGFELLSEANLVPVFAHRYIVCSSNVDSSVVLSIVVHATDAIVYADSLREYLEKEFLEP
ncbi:MAG TPA: SMI1/KNR4 family protein [Candidatus Acidoferrum sp.]|nr:SMI1/KNR4 family protein [Candidatus Acidoferrum sp.]